MARWIRLARKRLGEITVDDAAAYFVTYRDDDLTEGERKLLTSWLAAHDSHARALNRAEAIWQCFDQAEHDEILAAMRLHARQARPGRWMRFRGFSSWRWLRRYRHQLCCFLRR